MTFDPHFAYNVLLPLSAAAYELPLKKGVMPEGYEQVAPIRVADSHKTAKLQSLVNRNQFGWIYFSSKEKTLVVAYRGTDDFSDIVRDVDIACEDYKCAGIFGDVHSGFQTIYLAIRDSVINSCNFCEDSYDRIVLTGHSLGAALSELSAPDLYRKLRRHPKIEVINFAAPRVGKSNFAESFTTEERKTIYKCTRIVNRWDNIPRLPSLWTGYRHVGDQVNINGGFTLDGLHAHSLNNSYYPGLKMLL